MCNKVKKGFGLIYILLLISALSLIGAMTLGIVYNSHVTIRLALEHDKNSIK